MKIGDGPAAVIGDESRSMPLTLGREGTAGRTIRQSEDLPGHMVHHRADGVAATIYLWIKKGNPGSQKIRDFPFFCGPCRPGFRVNETVNTSGFGFSTIGIVRERRKALMRYVESGLHYCPVKRCSI